MADNLEVRLHDYIKQNAVDGRLLIKLSSLADALSETKNPVYGALNSLVKKRKIKKSNRSRMGIEIFLNGSGSSSSTHTESTEAGNFDEVAIKTIPFNELAKRVRALSLPELIDLLDIVENSIRKKEKNYND